jgi:hypothetical protein
MTHRPSIDEPTRRDISWKEILVSWVGLIAIFIATDGLVLLLSGTCPDAGALAIGTSIGVIADGRQAAEQDDFETQGDRAATLAGLDNDGTDSTARPTSSPAQPSVQHVEICTLSVHPEIHAKPSG